MYIQNEIREGWGDWLNDRFDFERALFLTVHLDEYLSWRKDDLAKAEVSKRVKRFFRRLEKKCFKSQKKRLEKFTVIETKNRNHVHIVVETPQHLSNETMKSNVELSFRETQGFGKPYIVNMRKKSGLIEYLTKEVDLNKDTVDLKNLWVKR